MSQDYRNEFLNEVKLALIDHEDADAITSKISLILDRYEIAERSTDLVPADNANMDLIKLYASALVIDGKAKSTIAQYVRTLKHFAAFQGGKNLKDLGAFDVRNYLAKKKLDGISNKSLENNRAILSAFYSWLAAEDIIPKSPCASIKPIKFQEEIKLPFSSVELDRIRSACKSIKERSIVEFLLASGVRVSELCNLDVTDVDFASGCVHVRHGKGDKDRNTYINDLAKEHLLQYLDDRKTGPLFESQQLDRYTKGGVRFLLHSIGDRAGIKDVHPHRFRRTFATTLAARGMKLQEIQKLMGHSNINTTMIYVTISDQETQFSYKKFA